MMMHDDTMQKQTPRPDTASVAAPPTPRKTLWGVFVDFLKQHKLFVASALLMLVAYPLEQVAFPQLYGKIIERVSGSASGSGSGPRALFDRIKYCLLALVVLLVIAQSLYCTMDTVDSYMIPRLQAHYRQWLVRDVLQRFECEYKELEMGTIISKILKLPLTVRDLYHQFRVYIVPCLLVTCVALAYFFYADAPTGVVATLTLAVFYALTVIVAKACVPLSRRREIAHNALHETIDDSLSNLLSVYTAGNVPREMSHLQAHEKRFYRQYVQFNRCAVGSKIKFSVLYILTFVIINGFAIYRTCANHMRVGTLVSILFITTYLIADVQLISGEIYDLMYNFGVLLESQRFIDALLLRPRPRSTPRGEEVRDATPATPAAPATPADGTIEFRRVHFRYPHSTRYSLRDVTLRIPDGQSVVLMGPIGSGKSTVTKLILRLFDFERGSIRVGGVDVRRVPLPQLRRTIAYVPQMPKLFNRDIVYNVLYGNADASLTVADIERAIDRMQLRPMFRSLPKGLRTVCGKHGAQLSGGQRQIVMLLRILLRREARVLIFDEPTSALDAEHAAIVRRVMAVLMRSRTSIIITHDAAFRAIADRVLVLKDGRVHTDTSMKKTAGA